MARVVLEPQMKTAVFNSPLYVFKIVLEDNQKFLKLLELLGLYQEKGSILVFVHKQEHADELMKNLMKHSYPCLSLHGGIDQYDRDSTMDDFKSGNIKLLVRNKGLWKNA